MFRIGAKRYMVRIMEDRIFHNGEEVMGLCDETAMEIRLSPKLPLSQRLGVLLHELTHAHIYATGFPADVESFCDLVSTIAQMAITDLVSAGGTEALLHLRPGERLGDSTARIGLLRHRYCRCGGKIAAGDVRCERDVLIPDQVKICAYCDHCNQTLQWNETATISGLPSGIVVGEVQVFKGRALISSPPSVLPRHHEEPESRELRYVEEQYL